MLAVLASGVALALGCAIEPQALAGEGQILAVPDAAPGDIYGGAVGVSGEFAFVAAEWDDDDGQNSGAVWVFRKRDGTWERGQKLRAPDAAKGDNFGRSIAMDGDVAVIGAHWDNSGGNKHAGSAYIFRFDGERWASEQKLLARGAKPADAMGNAVSIAGDWAAVAAWKRDGVGPDSGVVYMFHFVEGRWRPAQILMPHDAAAQDQFGRGVWIDKEALIVGAWMNDARGEDSGAAYIFRLNGERWVQEQKLVAPDGKANDRLGFSVSLDGDRALVGAHKTFGGKRDTGAAHVFQFDGKLWQHEQELTVTDLKEGAWLGWAVALDGDQILLSAHAVFLKTNLQPGAAYLFEHRDGRWTKSRKLSPSDGHPGDAFSFHLALDAGTAVLGSWRHHHAGKDSGRAYAFNTE